LERQSRFDRWERENEAPRLLTEVANLVSLRIEVAERDPGLTMPGIRHTLHIVVSNAAALFQLPCGNPGCLGGGHDITESILRGLRAGQPQTRGEAECVGSVGEEPCLRRLAFASVATYETAS
jgi:hypothetical protein